MQKLTTPAQFLEALRKVGGEEWRALPANLAEVDLLRRMISPIPMAYGLYHAWVADDVTQTSWDSENWWLLPGVASREGAAPSFAYPWNHNTETDFVLGLAGGTVPRTANGWMFRVLDLVSKKSDASGTPQDHFKQVTVLSQDRQAAGAPFGPTEQQWYPLIWTDTLAWCGQPGTSVQVSTAAAVRRIELMPGATLRIGQDELEFVAGEHQELILTGEWVWRPQLIRGEITQP